MQSGGRVSAAAGRTLAHAVRVQSGSGDLATPVVRDSPLRPWGEPDGSTLPALDGLRALAVLAVLLTHVGFQTGRTDDGGLGAALSRLDIGVTVFFLLSGFLLYRPFVAAHFSGGPAPRLPSYLRNRALRILPAYWVLVLVAVPFLSPGRADPAELGWQVLLLQTTEAGHLLPAMTQTWSLVVEAGFYLVLPLLGWLARPRTPRTRRQQLRAEAVLLAGMAVTALAWRVAVHAGGLGDERVTTLWLPGYLDWFALGMGLAVLRAWRAAGGRSPALEDVTRSTGTWLVLAVLLFWLATSPATGPRGLTSPTAWEALFRHALYGATAACLLVPAVLHHGRGASGWERLLSTRPARFLGRISYGLFLWHLLALDLVFRLPGLEPFTGQALLVLALALPLSVVLAWVSLRVVEEPALRRKRPIDLR